MFILSSIEHRGFNLKSSFQLVFKAYKDKKWQSSFGKTPLIFLKKKMNDLNLSKNQLESMLLTSLKKKKRKEKIEKRRQKRRELAGRNKALKPKKEREQEKIEQEELRDKPNTLKKEFRAIGNIKKKSKTILK